MNLVELFDIYGILTTVIGIEFALLALIAFASILNAVRLDHAIRNQYAERVEMVELLYDDSLKKQNDETEERERMAAEMEEESARL